jgi:hypothetical protein
MFRLTSLNKSKSNELDHINGKTSFIFKEIWVFPNLTGILRLFFKQSEFSYNRATN